MRFLQRRLLIISTTHQIKTSFGPFNSTTQRRWKKKPASTAQTRLETRTKDLKLDKLTTHLHNLTLVSTLHHLMSTRKRAPFVSLQIISRWTNLLVGLNISTTDFIRKYPHIFQVFTHPLRKNPCCQIRAKMSELVKEEEAVIRASEIENVRRLKKILMMSINGTIRVHALRLIRRELGLPEDFRDSILAKYSNVFRLIDLEVVGLVDRDDEALGEVEKWREREFREKWLSEFETKYAFPINFPTGFVIEAGFRERLRNWQRLPYVKPYESKEMVKVRTCGGIERFEKRVVGILHEFLCLTVERMVEVERLAHFRRDFGIEVNVRELLLKHPGIFYISTKGKTQTVFLREAYSKGCLIEPNPIYVVRRKMLDLILLGRRNTRELGTRKETKDDSNNVVHSENEGGTRDGDWVIPFLDSSNDLNKLNESGSLSEEEINGLS